MKLYGTRDLLEPVLVLALLKILLIHQVEYLHELQFGLNFYPLK